MCVHRCPFCDISVDINSFVNTDPMQLHKARSPNCPLVTGAASNMSVQERGQISGHSFIKHMFQATTSSTNTLGFLAVLKKNSNTNKGR